MRERKMREERRQTSRMEVVTDEKMEEIVTLTKATLLVRLSIHMEGL